jgi:hypothetical protein
LFNEVAARLTAQGLSNCNRRQLYRYRDFFRAYPEIVRTVSPQLKGLLPMDPRQIKKVGTAAPQLRFPVERLLRSLSYSHFELLIEAGDPLKRAFYEFECVKGQWSVRELKRQIASLFYERTGLSHNKKALEQLAQAAGAPTFDVRSRMPPPAFNRSKRRKRSCPEVLSKL